MGIKEYQSMGEMLTGGKDAKSDENQNPEEKGKEDSGEDNQESDK